MNHGEAGMSDNKVSDYGKVFSEEDMSDTALDEAVKWTDFLLKNEYRGRGDKEYLARYRLAKRTGVSESYIYRLTYKAGEMRDVAGSVYKALRETYIKACEANEREADRMAAERRELSNEKTDEKSGAQVLGEDQA